LKPFDEAAASHPSLDKRVASVRRIASEMGLADSRTLEESLAL
jgi:hypothetical protein